MTHSCFLRGFEDVPRAVYMYGPECRTLRLLDDADEMDDALAAMRRLFERGFVGHVALDNIDADVFEGLALAGISYEGAYGNVVMAQAPDQVAADKSRSTGNEYHV
jgi:hypothetical protein